MVPAMIVALELAALGPGHHETDLAATALRTYQPLAPIQDRGIRAVPGSHLGRVGLDLMLAGFAPDDQPDLGRSGGAEGHRGAVIGVHALCQGSGAAPVRACP